MSFQANIPRIFYFVVIYKPTAATAHAFKLDRDYGAV